MCVTEKSVNLYRKWRIIKVHGDSGHCTNTLGKQGIRKREEIPIRGKNDFKTLSSRRSYDIGTSWN